MIKNNVTLKQEGIVIIPKKVSDKINYLCTKISYTEWSSVLFYKVIEGSLKDVKNLKLELVDIYLQDIGTFGSTEFENDVDLLDIYEKYEELEDCKIGSIHSHHSMKAYYSGTDIADMEKNCKVYNSYLSIVVNNKGEKVAKISLPMKKTESGQIDSKYEIKDDDNSPIILEEAKKEIKEEETTTLFINMKIEEEITEIPFDDIFINRINNKLKESRKPTYPSYNHSNYSNNEMYVKGYDPTHYNKKEEFDQEFMDDLEGVPIVNKKVISSFLEHYLSASGTQYKIKGRKHLYELLYNINSNWKDIKEYVGICDEYLFDIMAEFTEKGYQDEDLLIGAIKELTNYVSYNNVVDPFVESLSQFSRTFTRKTMQP